MNFTLPEARRERMDQLLEYLGDTSRYSEYYDGNRAEDFKKCFDIESEWCWKYADLMLRGMEKRELIYGAEHHIVPRAYYKIIGLNLHQRHHALSASNITTLSYGEHLYAHYCLALCSIGEMTPKMRISFHSMYNMRNRGPHKVTVSDTELIECISNEDFEKIRLSIPRIAKVENEGRTHRWEDPEKYKKEYNEINKEKIRETHRIYREKHKEELSLKRKKYCEEHPELIKQQRKESYARNRESNLAKAKKYRNEHLEWKKEYDKKYREEHLDERRTKDHEYYLVNGEKIRERQRERYANYTDADKERERGYRIKRKDKKAAYDKEYVQRNYERIRERGKEYRMRNRDAIRKLKKAYVERKHAAGYRRRKDPVTGKQHWVFVGLPAQEVAA